MGFEQILALLMKILNEIALIYRCSVDELLFQYNDSVQFNV